MKYHYKACLTTPSAYRVSIHPSYMSIFTAKCKTKQFLRVHLAKNSTERRKIALTLFSNYGLSTTPLLRLCVTGAGPRQAWQLQHWAKIDLWHNVATVGMPPNNQRLIPIHIHNSQLSLPEKRALRGMWVTTIIKKEVNMRHKISCRSCCFVTFICALQDSVFDVSRQADEQGKFETSGTSRTVQPAELKLPIFRI